MMSAAPRGIRKPLPSQAGSKWPPRTGKSSPTTSPAQSRSGSPNSQSPASKNLPPNASSRPTLKKPVSESGPPSTPPRDKPQASSPLPKRQEKSQIALRTDSSLPARKAPLKEPDSNIEALEALDRNARRQEALDAGLAGVSQIIDEFWAKVRKVSDAMPADSKNIVQHARASSESIKAANAVLQIRPCTPAVTLPLQATLSIATSSSSSKLSRVSAKLDSTTLYISDTDSELLIDTVDFKSVNRVRYGRGEEYACIRLDYRVDADEGRLGRKLLFLLLDKPEQVDEWFCGLTSRDRG